MYTIITNNPEIAHFYGKEYDIRFMEDTSVYDVYDAIEILLQKHFVLITMPLPANVPIIRSPVRTVVLEKSVTRVDGEGLVLIGNARERTMTLCKGYEQRTTDVKDLRMIDLDQIKRAFMQIEELQLFA